MPIAYIHNTGTVFEKKMEKRERLGGGVYLEGTLAMVASEASFVVNALVCCQPINRIHSFITSSTFLGCSNKCHIIIYIFLRPPLQKKVTPNKTGEELRTLFIFQLKLRTARFLFSFFFPRFVLQSFFCSALCDRFFLLFSSLLVLAPPHCCFRMKIYKCGEGRKT